MMTDEIVSGGTITGPWSSEPERSSTESAGTRMPKHKWEYAELEGIYALTGYPRPAQRCARCGRVRLRVTEPSERWYYQLHHRWQHHETEPPCEGGATDSGEKP